MEHQVVRTVWQWRRFGPAGLAVLVALLHLGLRGLPIEAADGLPAAAAGLLVGLASWLVLDRLYRQVVQAQKAQADLQTAYQALQETHRRLLTVHEIGRKIADAADIQQVLELASRAPTHVADAKGAAVIMVDDQQGRLKLDMAWGLSDAYLARLRQRMEAGLEANRCLTCKPLTARLGGDCILFGGMDDLARQEGIQSLICLPIMRGQKMEGFINAYFPSPDGPPAEQLQLLNIVATEIAAALDSVRMRASQNATLYVIENLSAPDEALDDMLKQMLAITLAGWGAEHGALLLYHPDDESWHCRAERGMGSSPARALAQTLAESARKTGRPVLVPNLAAANLDPGAAGFRSAAAAPLLDGPRLRGVLVMATPRPDFFHPRQAPFITAIAHQAVLALNNAELHTRIQQVAVLEERYRLSREIHDGLAQTLSMLGWHLDMLKTWLEKGDYPRLSQEIDRGRQMAREAYMDVREAIEGLRVHTDRAGNLDEALREYLADFEERTGIQTHFQIDHPPLALSAETALQLLRIAQEALSNVRKHAQARQVWVELAHDEAHPQLRLTISDDGRGFDPALPKRRGHLGMSTMRERARAVHGDLSIVTTPGQGTRVAVTVPLAPAKE
ncbi:MAG: GAF domain-containing sensor histidine kinase [Chloroflexi bacterium]|nr:MAG: GAF domain-containing sensor histidine kinase [Chloroflexota bacterium]